MDVDFSFAKRRAEKEKQERLAQAKAKREAERKRSEAAAREQRRIAENAAVAHRTTSSEVSLHKEQVDDIHWQYSACSIIITDSY